MNNVSQVKQQESANQTNYNQLAATETSLFNSTVQTNFSTQSDNLSNKSITVRSQDLVIDTKRCLNFLNPTEIEKFIDAALQEFSQNDGWFSTSFRYTKEEIETFFSNPSVVLTLLKKQNKGEIEYLNFLVKVQQHFPRAFLKLVLPSKMQNYSSEAWIEKLQQRPFVSKEFLLRLVDVLQDKRLFLELLIAHPGMYSLELLEDLLVNGLPIRANSLLFAIYWHDNEIFDLLLKYTPENCLTVEDAPHYLTYILYYENIDAAEKLLKKGLVMCDTTPYLEQAVVEGKTSFVAWLFNRGFRPNSQFQYNQLVKKALETENLELIQLVCEEGAKQKQKITPSSYPEVLNFKPEDALSRLKSWLLLSPLEKVYALADNKGFSSLKLHLPALVKKLGFTTRFSLPEFRAELNSKWKDRTTYVEATWNYIEENALFARKLLPNLQKMAWKELLNEIIQERFNKRKKDEKEGLYILPRSINSEEAFTWILGSPNDLMTAPPRCRYAPSVSIFIEHLKENNISLFSDVARKDFKIVGMTVKPSMSPKKTFDFGVSYIFHYPLSETKTIPTTILSLDALIEGGPFKLVWRHTSVESIQLLQPEVERLHREILDFKLDGNNEKELKTKIVRCYWLISTMCEITRGTPHNAMIWLNLVSMYHNLQTPIPKRKYFFLDNAMLMLPVETVVQKWDTFFEALDPKGPETEKALIELEELVNKKFHNSKIKKSLEDRNLNLMLRQASAEPNYIELLKFLLDNRFSLYIDIQSRGEKSGTALDVATNYNNTAAIELLENKML